MSSLGHPASERPRIFREAAWKSYRRGFEFGRMLEHNWLSTRVLFPGAVVAFFASAGLAALPIEQTFHTTFTVVAAGEQRVVSVADGAVEALVEVGATVTRGAPIASVAGQLHVAPVDGVVRLTGAAQVTRGDELFTVAPATGAAELVLGLDELPAAPWKVALTQAGQRTELVVQHARLERLGGRRQVRASVPPAALLAAGSSGSADVSLGARSLFTLFVGR